jgi:DNA-binding SARP family transcriptional activator
VLSRTVWRGAEAVSLTRRALSLVIILAVLKRVPGQRLIDWLWGAGDVEGEANALKMLISRVRRKLGDASFITVSQGTYALRDDVVVDLHEIESFVGSLAANDPLTDAQIAALRIAHEQFRFAWLSQETVPSIDAAIAAARHRIVERLAHDALARDDVAGTLALADELRRFDSSDESAYELLIRAHVRGGNPAAALREYRRYAEHLERDLGVKPSFSIEDLLRD